jgi:hypothetical protein
MRKSTFIWMTLLCGVLSVAGPAFADGHGKDGKDKKEERKEERKEEKDKRDGGPHSDKDGGGADRKAELKKRRDEHMAEMRAKWGEILKKPGVKEEMRLHARRLARLRRMEKLAADAKKDALVKRANAAEEREKARHQKKMDELKAQPAPAGSAPAAGGAK